MHEFSLHVKKWCAWVPGIDHSGSWSDWTRAQAQEALSDLPDVRFIKPMLRRRLSKVSKLALYAAHQCQSNEHPYQSGIFCSRHGEAVRTLSIYRSLAENSDVSPTQFSQSVHSAAAGMFSIENQLHIPFTAIAAGVNTAEQGFIEAWAQLASGHSGVLMVMADEHLGAPFDQTATAPEFSFSVALLLGQSEQSPQLTLRQSESKSPIVGGTDNLLAALTGQAELRLQGNNGWEWQWHG